VAQQNRRRNGLHLQVGQVLPQTKPGSRIEGNKLVRVLKLNSVPFGREPPLWLELQAILAPYELHPPNGVNRICDGGARRNESPIGENIVLNHMFGVFRNRRVKAQRLGQGCFEIDETVYLFKHERFFQPRGDVFSTSREQNSAEFMKDVLLHARVLDAEPEEPAEGHR